MVGRNIFVSAVGMDLEAGKVKKNYNAAKILGKVRFGKDIIIYKNMDQYNYIQYVDVVWAYRRVEDVSGKIGGREEKNGLHSIMIVAKDGQRMGILIGTEKDAAEGLKLIEGRSRFVDIGYTKEKEEKYQAGGWPVKF